MARKLFGCPQHINLMHSSASFMCDRTLLHKGKCRTKVHDVLNGRKVVVKWKRPKSVKIADGPYFGDFRDGLH